MRLLTDDFHRKSISDFRLTNKDVNQRNSEQRVIFNAIQLYFVYYWSRIMLGWSVVWYGMVWQAKCSQWILIMTHKSNDMWTPLISSMGRIFWSLDSAIVICSVRLLVCFFSCFFLWEVFGSAHMRRLNYFTQYSFFCLIIA